MTDETKEKVKLLYIKKRNQTTTNRLSTFSLESLLYIKKRNQTTTWH